jgi:hypothetical protein
MTRPITDPGLLVEVPLFGLNTEPTAKPTTDQARALRQAARMGHGLHPLGSPLHAQAATTDDRKAPGLRCDGCIHVLATRRRYLKCDAHTITHGPGTDLRLWWPACDRWEAKA